MKAYELLDAVGGIDERYIQQAAPKKNRKKRWIRWGTLAACLCLAVAVTFFSRLSKLPPISLDPNHSEAAYQNDVKNPLSSVIPDDDVAETQDHSQGGIFIPAIELPEASDNAVLDMIGLVVYQGGIYTQTGSGSYYGESAQKIEALVGEYLGYATGTLNEWSTRNEYAQEFASTYTGEVYAVKGYDTSFRVCIRQEVAGEDGKPVLWIEILDRLNGITISKGKDVFEDRLHLKGRVVAIQWQAHEDWNYNGGNIQDAPFGQDTWDSFLDAVDQGEFINMWMPNESFYENHPNSSIFDTPNQTHLILTMEDGTKVKLSLIEGGYVGYEATGWWYFVQIPGETFDAIYDACGGAHLTDW